MSLRLLWWSKFYMHGTFVLNEYIDHNISIWKKKFSKIIQNCPFLSPKRFRTIDLHVCRENILMKVWKFIITKLTNAKPQKQKQTTPPPKKNQQKKQNKQNNHPKQPKD